MRLQVDLNDGKGLDKWGVGVNTVDGGDMGV